MGAPVKPFFKYAFTRICVLRSMEVALVGGTLRGIINHFDGLFGWRLTGADTLRILLACLVPYAVATYVSESSPVI